MSGMLFLDNTKTGPNRSVMPGYYNHATRRIKKSLTAANYDLAGSHYRVPDQRAAKYLCQGAITLALASSRGEALVGGWVALAWDSSHKQDRSVVMDVMQ